MNEFSQFLPHLRSAIRRLEEHGLHINPEMLMDQDQYLENKSRFNPESYAHATSISQTAQVAELPDEIFEKGLIYSEMVMFFGQYQVLNWLKMLRDPEFKPAKWIIHFSRKSDVFCDRDVSFFCASTLPDAFDYIYEQSFIYAFKFTYFEVIDGVLKFHAEDEEAVLQYQVAIFPLKYKSVEEGLRKRAQKAIKKFHQQSPESPSFAPLSAIKGIDFGDNDARFDPYMYPSFRLLSLDAKSMADLTGGILQKLVVEDVPRHLQLEVTALLLGFPSWVHLTGAEKTRNALTPVVVSKEQQFRKGMVVQDSFDVFETFDEAIVYFAEQIKPDEHQLRKSTFSSDLFNARSSKPNGYDIEITPCTWVENYWIGPRTKSPFNVTENLAPPDIESIESVFHIHSDPVTAQENAVRNTLGSPSADGGITIGKYTFFTIIDKETPSSSTFRALNMTDRTLSIVSLHKASLYFDEGKVRLRRDYRPQSADAVLYGLTREDVATINSSFRLIDI